MNYRKLIVLFFLLGSGLANAQDNRGFDDEYKVYSGSSNNDGLTDLLIARATSKTNFIRYRRYSIPIDRTPVQDFILENNGDGTFDIIESNVKDLSAWTEVDVAPRIRDFNIDGRNDLILNGVSAVINGAHNQIVYAPFPNQTSRIPTALTPMDEDFESFFQDIYTLLADPNLRPSPRTNLITSSPPNNVDPQDLIVTQQAGITTSDLVVGSKTEILLVDGSVSIGQALERQPSPTSTCVPPHCLIVRALPQSSGECYSLGLATYIPPLPAINEIENIIGLDLCSLEPRPGAYWLIRVDDDPDDGVATGPEDIPDEYRDPERLPTPAPIPPGPGPGPGPNPNPDNDNDNDNDNDPVAPAPEDPDDTEPEVVFDERARQVATVIERLNANCPSTMSDEDAEVLREIADSTIGEAITAAATSPLGSILAPGFAALADNTLPHPEFATTTAMVFNESSLTYHH